MYKRRDDEEEKTMAKYLAFFVQLEHDLDTLTKDEFIAKLRSSIQNKEILQCIEKLEKWDFLPGDSCVRSMLQTCISKCEDKWQGSFKHIFESLHEKLAKKVTDEFLMTHDNVDWETVSRCCRFTNQGLLQYEEKLHWVYIVGYYADAPVELLVKHAFDDPDCLSERAHALGWEEFGDELLEICPDRVWRILSGRRDLSDEFIEKWGHRISWEDAFNSESGDFIRRRKDVSQYVEKYCRDGDLSDVALALLLSEGKLSFDFIMKRLHVAWKGPGATARATLSP